MTIWMTNCRATFRRAILRLALRHVHVLAATILTAIEAELDDLLLLWMIDRSRLSDLRNPPLLAPIDRVGQVLDRRGELIQGCP